MSQITRKRPALRAKKSYTLSPESVAFLESMRKRRRARSVSSILEEILQAVRREQGKAALDKAVSDYYSSLTNEDAAELTSWGEFAMREFPDGSV